MSEFSVFVLEPLGSSNTFEGSYGNTLSEDTDICHCVTPVNLARFSLHPP